MIDLSKPVQTRDGRKVRILCTDANCRSNGTPQPIVGLVEGSEQPSAWCLDGSFFACIAQDKTDLVNVPPAKVKVEVRLWRDLDGGPVCSCSQIIRDDVPFSFDHETGIKWLATTVIEMEYEEQP